ncbi:hypothetical protein DBV15_01202 [Temnothorax longispinosus]|uniref:Uncharacterized protein n=1 Tax=Temnothorax longispinosus TaxID=300112 RepID=A0A4S2J9B6_9HYME|nr:hypothetical protein DBV15_01202 [Temnothorax longispinosus]
MLLSFRITVKATFARTFFYPANINAARQSGDNSRLYCPRISPFQGTPIFATELLGYSTLAGFMVFDVGAARALAKKERINNAVRAYIAWRDPPTRRKPILTIPARPGGIDDKIEERRARRRPALKSSEGFGFIVSAARIPGARCDEKESLTGKPCPPPLSAVITRR